MFGTNAFSGSSLTTTFFSKATNSIAASLGCPSLSSLGLNFSNIYNTLKQQEDSISSDLKDYNLQTSTYNKIIPEVFGKVRISGNIMWTSEITKTSIHHAQKTTKNGVQNAYTEYLVRGSFAIAICKGVVDEIQNIYANDEPLNLATYNIKIYYGDEEQRADPTIQSYLGVDIPAFRGLCYVVFTEFPMEQFNNTIPNFTFDIIRRKELQENNDVENLVSCVNIIPGSGEFVYDTKTQKKLNGNWLFGKFYETDKAIILNKHTSSQYTDAIDSLNDLQNTFPNLKWVSLVVCWFCDNLNCKYASIYPACENNTTNTTPDIWKVAGLSRQEAKVVSCDKDGNIRYGGTPSDDCVKRYAKEIKKRGLKLCLYPMLMVDVEQKPWRGYISGNSEDVANFFQKADGYNNFIKHYTRLLKDDIDAVIIGSEMKSLTSIFNEQDGTYPAVEEFCNLAQEIKNIVNTNTKITYTSDWSEYHHDNRGNYNLDTLWSNENIDFIGIDAYFPLTDLSETTYDIEKIKTGWRSGEGYDFYYTDDSRTTKQNLDSQWAWKNVEWFWNNEHYNLNGTKTSWIPKSKKIWFMEYGFPSVDCCTNQPNVFYSKGSLDSAFPRNSTGSVDFKAQRVAIKATELAWKDSECVENKFLYTWDARPYPYFPNLKDVWADADCWKYGHFLNGKLGTATLANIINYLCKKLGLEDKDYDTTLLKDELIEGYLIDDKKSVLSHIKILSNAFNFDAYLENGRIIFKSLLNTETHKINENDLLIDTENNHPAFKIEQYGEINIPTNIELLFMDTSDNYKTSTAIAKDDSKNNKSYSISANIPMSRAQAQQIAWKILSNLTNQKIYYSLKLPITYLNICPLDTIELTFDNEKYLMRVKSIEIIDLTTISLVCFSIIANENILTNLNYSNQPITNSVKTINEIAKTNIKLFELHNIRNNISNNTFDIHCAIWSDNNNWNGASLYYSTDNEQNYEVLKYINTETSIGKLINMNNITNISANYIDTQTEIVFSLLNENGKLQSITDDEFLELKNIVLIGNEIIAFKDVEQIEKNIFKISNLLRGRFNTEEYINNHQNGEDVILLDNDLPTIELPITMKGKTIFVKTISNGDSLINVEAKKITLQGLSLIDFQSKNFDKKILKNGDIILSFSPRKNYKLNNIQNIEISNKLLLYIYDHNGNIKRQIKLENTARTIYTTSMQIEDFGRQINEQEFSFDVKNLLKL